MPFCFGKMMTLDSLSPRMPHRVTAIDWAALPAGEGHRLRSLGLEEGAVVELLHRGVLFWRDPLAVRIGRMTVALRRKNAAAVSCVPIDGGAA